MSTNWYKKNRTRQLRLFQEYYKRNRQRIRAKGKRSWAKWYKNEKNRKSHIKKAKQYYDANRSTILLKQRDKRLSKYSLTDAKFKELMQQQNSCCILCSLPFTKNNKPHIDHCHETSQFRGIIHHKCNMVIGFANDNVLLLQQAIKYLQSH